MITTAPCDNCTGLGRYPCRRCDGQPVRRCWNCNADDEPGAHLNEVGTARWHEQHRSPTCRECKGTGQIVCSGCDGAGEIECAPCTGSGRVPVYVSPLGVVVPTLPGSRLEYGSPRRYGRADPRFAPGLGAWRVGPTGAWLCLSPSGDVNGADYATTVTSPEPPPLARAGYRGVDQGGRCGECGTDGAWIEFHGMADGYCTRCHYRG